MDNSTDYFKYPPPLDPFSQPITILLGDGTPINITLTDLSAFRTDTCQTGIHKGAAAGCSLLMLIFLLLLTPAAKRRAPIFGLSALALTLNSIKLLLQAAYLLGPFLDVYAFVADDFSRVPQCAVNASVAATVLSPLVLVCALVGLWLQIRVVTATIGQWVRRGLLLGCAGCSLLTAGFAFALMVVNCENIVGKTTGDLVYFERLQYMNLCSLVGTFCLFTGVFVAHLSVVLFKRRGLGMEKFGPMQVVFFMGVESLIVPTIFAGLQFDTHLYEMGTWFLTLVVLSLPLSSLWAASTVADMRSTQASRPIFSTGMTGSSGMSKSRGRSTVSNMSGSLSGAPVLPQTAYKAGEFDSDVEKMGFVQGRAWNLSGNRS